MTLWTPINQGQITSNDPEGPRSCVSYSFAYAVSDATNGRFHPTGNTIRDWTGDHLGGLELDACDRAVAGHLAIDFRTDVYTRAEFYGLLAKGYGAVQIIGYQPVGATKFDGSPGFIGNHAWYVPPGLAVMDPLADGRRPGVYRYKGEVYPKSLIDAAAANLNVGDEHHRRHAGPDHFEASFVRLEAAPKPARFTVTVAPGTLAYYPANKATRRVAQHGAVVARTKGFTDACTAPLRFLWTGHGSLVLVQLLDDPHKGMWINARSPRVHVVEA